MLFAKTQAVVMLPYVSAHHIRKLPRRRMRAGAGRLGVTPDMRGDFIEIWKNQSSQITIHIMRQFIYRCDFSECIVNLAAIVMVVATATRFQHLS
jgi:hypothetical protein